MPAVAAEQSSLVDTDIIDAGPVVLGTAAHTSTDAGSTDHLSKKRKIRFA